MHKRISILEDDAGIREIVTLLLESEGYEVSTFSDVSSFMARNTSNEPDLYLLDIKLPDGNGLEVCNLLKSARETKHIPIVMMSAHEGVEQMRKNCKAEDFIAKPFDIYEFLGRVTQVIADSK